MSQLKTYTWTNAASAVARNQLVGFYISRVTTIDITNGGSWQWTRGMAAASYLDVDAGSITTSNGFTLLSQNATYGAAISGFTNANPGVLTVDDTATVGFAVGDTIKVAELSDDLTGTASLNGTYTIASLTATTITTATDTTVTGYSVWVSGGVVTRITGLDEDGVSQPIPTQNFAIEGITIGTGPVGANNASMVALVEGGNPVT